MIGLSIYECPSCLDFGAIRIEREGIHVEPCTCVKESEQKNEKEEV